MKSRNELLKNYHDYHKKTITKLTHFIGIPMIVFSLMMFFDFIYLAWIATAALLLYYLTKDVLLTLATAIFLVPLTYAAVWTNESLSVSSALWVATGLFILGWVFQLIGHYFEGNKPALLDNFSQLFTAPIFLVAELLALFSPRFRKGW